MTEAVLESTIQPFLQSLIPDEAAVIVALRMRKVPAIDDFHYPS